MQEPEPVLNDFQFRDRKGRIWDTFITYLDAERVDKSDFTDIFDRPFCFATGPTTGQKEDSEAFLAAIMQSSMCIAIIWVIVLPQVKDVLGIDPFEGNTQDEKQKSHDRARDEFLSGMDGRTVADAKEALWRAIADFFPEQRTLLENMRNQIQKVASKFQTKMESESGWLDQEMEKLIDQKFEEARQSVTAGVTSGEKDGMKSGD